MKSIPPSRRRRARTSTTARVLVLQPELKQYRKPFFEGLAAALRARDIELKVAYSDPVARERSKGDAVELGSDLGIKVPALWLLGERLVLQPVLRPILDADLIIVDQANRYILNYLLLGFSRFAGKKIAYWGHGYNHQEPTPGLSERLKARLLTRADWWFAYTDGVKRYLVTRGVATDIITAVGNTIDTDELRSALGSLSPESIDAARRELGIAKDARIGLYCGGIYEGKQLRFLFSSAERIRRRVPAFELVLIGDGPDRTLVESAAREHTFVHYAGTRFGADRARYFAMSEVFLMPGMVGLSIVDAFTAGLPLITTRIPTHGPEIEYLEHRINGIQCALDPDEYAHNVADVFSSPEKLSSLRRAALATAERLSMASMVGAFADGVSRCLNGP